MEKSNIAQGQMFLHFDNYYMEKPRVWVKIKNEELDGKEVSLFIDNEVLALIAIGAHDVKEKGIGIHDKWFITDEYYGKCVRNGKFVPLDDLRKTDDICEQLGWPKYEIDLEF